jgi:hypothetical protein
MNNQNTPAIPGTTDVEWEKNLKYELLTRQYSHIVMQIEKPTVREHILEQKTLCYKYNS